jgi:hypothetical protein
MDSELPGPLAASDKIWRVEGTNDSTTGRGSSEPVSTDVWFAVRVVAFGFGVRSRPSGRRTARRPADAIVTFGAKVGG